MGTLKSVQEMEMNEFVEAFLNAEDNDLVCENIMKKWSCEENGYWYVANAGDCDGGDTIQYWFAEYADEKGYVEELDARI
jgi:hypothetical protein